MSSFKFITSFFLIIFIAFVGCSAKLIPDPNLERAIRVVINKPSGALTKADLQSLTKLEAPDEEIKSIRGLENCTNLTNLNLMHNKFSSLSPISGLTGLKELYLDSEYISDISPIARLTNLEFLSLQGCNLSDVSAINALSNLRFLNLDQTKFANSDLARRY